ncbi:MAG: hypothetical protein ABIV06_12420, partial [Thermoanaerobaculia bacterium]
SGNETGIIAAPVRGFGLATIAAKFDSPSPGFLPASPPAPPLDLPWNCFAVTSRGEKTLRGGLDGRGRAVPRELLPRTLCRAGAHFDLGHAFEAGSPSALRCAGQLVVVPSGFRRLLLLAAAFPWATEVEFVVDGVATPRRVAGGFAPLGRFDELERGFFGRPTGGVVPGFLRIEPVALAIPHRHDRHGAIDPCAPALFFAVELAVPSAGSELLLPQARNLIVLAAALSDAPSPGARSVGAGEFG